MSHFPKSLRLIIVVLSAALAVAGCGSKSSPAALLPPTATPVPPTPTPNPLVALVQSILPPGYKYVADYVTTVGGDSVWVIEVTEPQTQMVMLDIARLFREFAKTVDTSSVAWLELSVIKSDGYMPYAHCVHSGPARAAANGTISDLDLFMQLSYCPQ